MIDLLISLTLGIGGMVLLAFAGAAMLRLYGITEDDVDETVPHTANDFGELPAWKQDEEEETEE